MALALGYAEGKSLVHRDVKPENILLAPDGTPKLADLGLAKEVNEAAASLTQTGVVMGTPLYMAPEQALAETLDVRADIYALGLCLWRMLTGRVPYDDSGTCSSLMILTMHINEDLPDVRTRGAQVAEGTAKVVGWMCARERDDRYLSANDVAKDIDRILAGGEPEGPAPVLPETVNANVSDFDGLPASARLAPTMALGDMPKASSDRLGRASSSRRAQASSASAAKKGPALSTPVMAGVLVAALGVGMGLAVAVAVSGKRSGKTATPSPVPTLTDPGSVDPGSVDPGSVDPGSVDPGSSDPGSSDPEIAVGTEPVDDPETEDPESTAPVATAPTGEFALDDPDRPTLDSEESLSRRVHEFVGAADSIWTTLLFDVEKGERAYKQLKRDHRPEAYPAQAGRSLRQFYESGDAVISLLTATTKAGRKAPRKRLEAESAATASPRNPIEEAHQAFVRRSMAFWELSTAYSDALAVPSQENMKTLGGHAVRVYGAKEATAGWLAYGAKGSMRWIAFRTLISTKGSPLALALVAHWRSVAADVWPELGEDGQRLIRDLDRDFGAAFLGSALGQAQDGELADVLRYYDAVSSDDDASVVGALLQTRFESEGSRFLKRRLRAVEHDSKGTGTVEGARGLLVGIKREPTSSKSKLAVTVGDSLVVELSKRALKVGSLGTFKLTKADWGEENVLQVEVHGTRLYVRLWDVAARTFKRCDVDREEGETGFESTFSVEAQGIGIREVLSARRLSYADAKPSESEWAKRRKARDEHWKRQSKKNNEERRRRRGGRGGFGR